MSRCTYAWEVAAWGDMAQKAMAGVTRLEEELDRQLDEAKVALEQSRAWCAGKLLGATVTYMREWGNGGMERAKSMQSKQVTCPTCMRCRRKVKRRRRQHGVVEGSWPGHDK